MNLSPAPSCSLRIVRQVSSDHLATSELIISGTPTGKLLDGAILEAALAWGEQVLLFISDDVLFEDGLHIYLLDQRFHTLDSAHMVAMGSTGVFSGLDLAAPDAVRFRFFGGIVYTLTLLHKETFALPWFSDPGSVWRPFKWTRRFRLDSHQVPQAAAPPPGDAPAPAA